MGSELDIGGGCGQLSLPCLVEWGVGVLWRETAAAEAMIESFPLTILWVFGTLVVVAKDIVKEVGV